MKKLSVVLLSSVGLLLTSSNVIANEEVPDSLQQYIRDQVRIAIANKSIAELDKRALESANKEYDQTKYVPNIPRKATSGPEQGEGNPWRKVKEAENGKAAQFIVNFYDKRDTIPSLSQAEIDAKREEAVKAIVEDKKGKIKIAELEAKKTQLQEKDDAEKEIQDIDAKLQEMKETYKPNEKKPYEVFKAGIIAQHAKQFESNYTENSFEGEGKVEQGWLGTYIKA